MLIKDRLAHLGPVFFKYRGWQHIPMLFVLLLEWRHFGGIPHSPGYEVFCAMVSGAGLLVRALTIGFVPEGTSGRNRVALQAVELNTTGAYSVVRNPLYLANYLILLGISLLTQNHEVVLLNTVLFAILYLPIILHEEAFLLERFGDSYRSYAARVNCIIPSFRNFTRTGREFSLRMLLKREHDTLFTTMLGLLLIELLREYGRQEMLRLNTIWLGFAAAVGVTWAILKYLKRTGHLVD